MVDFSDRDELKKWFEGQSRAVHVVVATRVALRILPVLYLMPRTLLVESVFNTEGIIHIFRALDLSWMISAYPSHKDELQKYSNIAEAAARNSGNKVPTGVADKSRAGALRNLAFSAAHCIDMIYSLFADISHAILLSEGPAQAINVDILSSVASDISYLDNGYDAIFVAQTPLWPEGTPENLSRDWHMLKHMLLALGNNWEVWTDWYDARLVGKPEPIEALELARAAIEDETWQQGSVVINAHIKELIEKYTPPQKADLKQRLAPYEFYAKGGKILARPLEGHPEYPDMAEDMRDDLKQKIEELRARLASTQTPKRLLDTLGRLDDVLGQTLEKVKPGLLLSRSRSLAADINAYDTVQGRVELAEDALAGMKDVLSSLDDLKACYPEIAKLEAAALAQKMTGGMAEKFMEQSDKIIEVAEQAPDSISHKAIEGLKALLPDIEGLREIIRYETDDQKIADAQEKVGKLAALHSLTLRNFVAFSIREAKEVKRLGKSYKQDIEGNGVKTAVAVTVAVGVAGMVTGLAAPVTAIAALRLMAWVQFPAEIDDFKDRKNSDDEKG